MTEMGYPIVPMVIGVILGPMADANLRRALVLSQGSFMPIFRFNGLIPERPVALILFLIIVYMILSQIPFVQRLSKQMLSKLFSRKKA